MTNNIKNGIAIEDELRTDFFVYASCVNNERSFADARDGLKPSQRAVCWTMYTDGYLSNKPHVKCAKISGSTIARIWPHGDVGVYETLARMSQPWLNNICEIDFHGANGSLVGGPDCANQRYTEARLSKATEDGLINTIKKNTVDMIPNYCEDESWPSVLPAIFPRLFVNGSQGIGFTIAQEWEPGNLNEITEKVKEYISSGKVTTDNIYPDYPTGGIIINKSELHSIYETGKGQIILRGKTDIVGKYINITELPYQVYAEPLIQKIKDLVNAGTLTGIEDICNKSDDNGLFIEIECTDNPQVVLNKLYKLTDLQVSFNANQMALVDGVPALLNLENYIKVYVNHNITCLQREYTYDLDKAVARKEIVDGLIKAISIIDAVIATIKAAKSAEAAKQDLMAKFSFTENQVKAIIDMRLGKLANLEVVELNKELNELVKTIDYCNKFLSSDKLQKKEFLARLEAFTKKYSWERRTQVCDIDLVKEKQNIKVEKVEEDFTIILTPDNRLKKISTNKLKKIDDNFIKAIEIKANDRFILISEQGKMYKLDAKRIDTCSINSAGVDISTLIDDKILNIYSGNEPEEYLVLVTKFGKLLKLDANAIWNLSKNIGAPLIKLQNDDIVIFNNVFTDNNFLEISTAKKTKKIKLDEILTKGRNSQGIQCILLGKKDPEITSIN